MKKGVIVYGVKNEGNYWLMAALERGCVYSVGEWEYSLVISVWLSVVEEFVLFVVGMLGVLS